MQGAPADSNPNGRIDLPILRRDTAELPNKAVRRELEINCPAYVYPHFELRSSTHNRHPFFDMACTQVQRIKGIDHLVHQPNCPLTSIRKAPPEN
jgi:hypothetical protein